MKKKNQCRNRFWATAQLYCEFVLQALQLYCKTEGWKNCRKKKLYCNTIFVLQRGRLEDWKLYCNTADCIARMCSWLERKCIVGGVRLYCSIGRKIVLQAGNCIATLGC